MDGRTYLHDTCNLQAEKQQKVHERGVSTRCWVRVPLSIGSDADAGLCALCSLCQSVHSARVRPFRPSPSVSVRLRPSPSVSVRPSVSVTAGGSGRYSRRYSRGSVCGTAAGSKYAVQPRGVCVREVPGTCCYILQARTSIQLYDTHTATTHSSRHLQATYSHIPQYRHLPASLSGRRLQCPESGKSLLPGSSDLESL